tara:strand:- start:5140 stop:6714 length:1575 start_codon:yes stop_codon:yes gene_type:complete
MDIASGIYSTAKALGINPIDLATAISYETSGTFDPLSQGLETQYGQHRGFIQFGEPQANQYGVSFETRPQAISTQLGPGAGIYQYLKAVGIQPGMGLKQIYSAINTGGVNNFDMTDERAGGMPGTVAEKVAGMGDHRKNAQKFMELAMQNQPLNASPLLGPQNSQMPGNQQSSGMDKNPLFSMLGKTVGGGFSKLKDAVTGKDADASDRLAIALMSLSGNPQQLQPMMAMAAQDIKDRKTKRMTNQSLEYIRSVDPELAKLVEQNPALLQQVLSQVTAKQLRGKTTIMSADKIKEQFGQIVPLGTYEVTVGRDNQPTDISPINPNVTDAAGEIRTKLALQTSNEYGKNYVNMKSKQARLGILDSLLGSIEGGTGFQAGLAQFMFENFRIDYRDENAAAAGALINAMVPEMRPPGSGPMSDADLNLFKASAPSIAAKPGGNQLIIKTMQALANYELKFAEIHKKFASGLIKTIPERDRQIFALADPMEGVIDWMVENGVIEESQRPQNSISVSDEELSIFNEPTV